MMNTRKISSANDMIKFGEELAKKYSKILLYGDLGAGKTHLSKGFASGLGINPNSVQSPTYTYINEYDNKLLHIDMYRLESSDDLISKGILDQILSYEYIIIEWPKFTQQYADDQWTIIKIEKTSESERTVIIK